MDRRAPIIPKECKHIETKTAKATLAFGGGEAVVGTSKG